MDFKEIIEQQLTKKKDAEKRLENTDRYMGSIRLNQTTKQTDYERAIDNLTKSVAECERLTTEYNEQLASAKKIVEEMVVKQQDILHAIATLPASPENDAKYNELMGELNSVRKELADQNQLVVEITADIENNDRNYLNYGDELAIQRTAYEKFSSVVSRGDDLDLTGLAYADILTVEEFADVINPYIEDCRLAGRDTGVLLEAISKAIDNNESLFISDFHNLTKVDTNVISESKVKTEPSTESDLDNTIQATAAATANTDVTVNTGPEVLDEDLSADPVIKESKTELQKFMDGVAASEAALAADPVEELKSIMIGNVEHFYTELPNSHYESKTNGKVYETLRDMEDDILDMTQPLPAVNPAVDNAKEGVLNPDDMPDSMKNELDNKEVDLNSDENHEVDKFTRHEEGFMKRMFKNPKFTIIAAGVLLAGATLYSLVAGQQPTKVVTTHEETVSNDDLTSGNESLEVPSDAIISDEADKDVSPSPMAFTFSSNGTKYRATSGGTSSNDKSDNPKTLEDVVKAKNERLAEEAEERKDEHEATHGDEGAGEDTHVVNPEAGGPKGDPADQFPDTTPGDEGALDGKDTNDMFGDLNNTPVQNQETTPVPEIQTFSKGEIIDLSSQETTRSL